MYSSDMDVNMQINPALQAAAVGLVRAGNLETATQIPSYPGMLVSPVSDKTVQVMDAFVVDGVEYVIGPLKR